MAEAMASPVTCPEVQQTLLDASDYNYVVPACQPVSARWRDLGTRLGVLVHTLDSIETTHNGDVERCMPAMLDKWLRRPLGEVHDKVKPTWRSLCVALAHIDRTLADRLAEKHNCRDYISDPAAASDVTSSSDVVSPAFLPQMCGCGKCTIIGWRTGRTCQNTLFSEFPKLLLVKPKHSSASSFKQSYDSHASLCTATSDIIDHFKLLVSNIWEQLYESVENHHVDVAKITRVLRTGLGIQLPMFSDLDSLENHCHSLRVSWYNFRPLHLLVTKVIAKLSPTLLEDWNSYIARFKEYCSARNLKDFKDVFFSVEEHNVFLLKVDEFYDEFRLADMNELRESLSIALGCPSVFLHLVTVKEKCLIIYFYYSYSDYLAVFQSLTTEQLKKISQIKACKILSLTDLHNQFRYDHIQNYAEAPPASSVSTSTSNNVKKSEVDDMNFESASKKKIMDELHQEVEILKKISHFKDKDLSNVQAELSVARDDIKRKEEEIKALEKQLHLRDTEFTKKEAEEVDGLKKPPEEETFEKPSHFEDEQLSRTQAELMVAHKEIKRKEEEMKIQLHSREAELVDMINRQREEIKALEKQLNLRDTKLSKKPPDVTQKELPKEEQNTFNSELLTAALAGKKDEVIRLIISGAEIDYKEFDKNQMTALHYASKGGHSEVVKELLQRGATPTVEDKTKSAALHYASAGGYIEIVQALLDHKAELDFADKNQMTALHYASKGGHSEVVKELLQRGATPTVGDKLKRTPLHFGSEHGHTKVVQILVSNGAKIDSANGDRKTSLHFAAARGHIDVVQFLLDKDADSNIRDRLEKFPLHYASEKGHFAVVESLLSHGAIVDAKDRTKSAALHYASAGGHIEIVQTLLKHKAEFDVANNWHLPLSWALLGGHTDTAKCLVSHGATVSSKGDNEWTDSPILIATMFNNEEAIEHFVSSGNISLNEVQAAKEKYQVPSEWKVSRKGNQIEYTNTDTKEISAFHPKMPK